MAGKKPATTAKDSRPKTSSRPSAKAALTAKQQRFVEEYIVDLNATQAAIRAGYSAKTAGQIGDENLKKPQIAAAITASQKRLAERTGITQEAVLRRWWDLATSDAAELTAVHYRCCRYCYGEGHAYHWRDEAEFARAVANAKINDDPVPTDEGGYGHNPTAGPAHDCPKCYGEGNIHVHLADTRKLSDSGRLLFDGVKETKFGIEIKLQDRAKALENVARHLGMFNDKLTLKGDAENPLVALISQLSGKTLKPVSE